MGSKPNNTDTDIVSQDQIVDSILNEDGYGERAVSRYFGTMPTDKDVIRDAAAMSDEGLDKLITSYQRFPSPLNIIYTELAELEREKRQKKGTAKE